VNHSLSAAPRVPDRGFPPQSHTHGLAPRLPPTSFSDRPGLERRRANDSTRSRIHVSHANRIHRGGRIASSASSRRRVHDRALDVAGSTGRRPTLRSFYLVPRLPSSCSEMIMKHLTPRFTGREPALRVSIARSCACSNARLSSADARLSRGCETSRPVRRSTRKCPRPLRTPCAISSGKAHLEADVGRDLP